MQLNDEDANSSLRFSFSKYNTLEEVKEAVSLILSIFS
jgi:cysteine sulfinate desulfinase/cysteine desulfurase-like protein